MPTPANIGAVSGACVPLKFELRTDAGALVSAPADATWFVDAGTAGFAGAFLPNCTAQVGGLTFLAGESTATLVFRRGFGGVGTISLVPGAGNPHSPASFTASNAASMACVMTYGDCSMGALSTCCTGFACDAGTPAPQCCSLGGTACSVNDDCCSRKCEASASGMLVCQP